jgi:hypothetical protein
VGSIADEDEETDAMLLFTFSVVDVLMPLVAVSFGLFELPVAKQLAVAPLRFEMDDFLMT